jgi:hypothetical protein
MRVLIGCVLALAMATGAIAKTVTADDVAQFKVGVATPDDVISKLGKPMSMTTMSNGYESVAYTSIHARPKMTSFIPVVGLFAGGATGETSVVVFVFGPDHLLMNATTNSTNVDCSTHFVAVSCGH